jgi:thioredoxin-related protein
MKKLFLCLMLLITASATFAQSEKEINFLHQLSWQQVLDKAKAENKYIFIDCFTTWCGPCKWMDANTFKDASVVEYYNKNFVSVKLQMDITDKDNEEVKSWYKDMRTIEKTYGVRAYPTYLFFSPKGEIVHRSVGGMPADKFLAAANDATNPDKQYYALKKQYDNGRKDADFLYNLANAAKAGFDDELMGTAFTAYLKTQSDMFTEKNMKMIVDFTSKVTDPGFKLIKDNTEKFDKLLGNGTSINTIKRLVMNNVIGPVIMKEDPAKGTDFAELEKKVAEYDAANAKEFTSYAKVIYYQRKENWPLFQEVVLSYMSKYGSKLNAMELNAFAWTVFENCNDMKCVEKALEWAIQSTKKDDQSFNNDTVANLYFKLGNKKKAIEIGEKALALAKAKGEDTKDYETALKKYKGE